MVKKNVTLKSMGLIDGKALHFSFQNINSPSCSSQLFGPLTSIPYLLYCELQVKDVRENVTSTIQ